MKLRVQTEPDFDYEVIDVFLYIESDEHQTKAWILKQGADAPFLFCSQ